ncbi:MAG: hypothetical protein ACKO3A_02265 [Opitutia bacterium]
MPSDFVPRGAADSTFAAELSAALRQHGLRGAYARKLRAEWLGHYANLRDSLPAEEAIAQLGSPEELAASAARSRFEGRWWCAAPVASGILAGFIAFIFVTALSPLPLMLLVNFEASWKWGLAECYAQAFNWLGALAGLAGLGWLTGRLSTPPCFRRTMLISFALLVLMLSMDFNAPSGGPGTGSFTFGVIAGFGDTFSSQLMFYLLLSFRLAVFAVALRWCRRAA